MPHDFFSADYAMARQRFRDATEQRGWSLAAHPIAAHGPNANELTIDVAVSPAENGNRTARTVIVSSGLHGVEGFFGSAVQLALLEQQPALAAAHPEVRLIFIHALNPFGFAWLRRVNEANVDLNRNFLCSGEPYRGAPAIYRQLDGLLNPRQPPARFDGFYLQALAAILRRGMPALKQAIAEGQYDFPQGLFFGGHAPAETHTLLQNHLAEWIGDCPQVTHLDFHTGLGRWGTYKLLIEQTLTSKQRERLANCFVEGDWEHSSAEGVSYVSRGTLGRWCAGQFPERDYLYLCAEFGTYAPLNMLAGLRAENQATHWSADEAVIGRAREHLKELFGPKSRAWRAAVLRSAVRLVERACG